jgi:hypothetical protein
MIVFLTNKRNVVPHVKQQYTQCKQLQDTSFVVDTLNAYKNNLMVNTMFKIKSDGRNFRHS